MICRLVKAEFRLFEGRLRGGGGGTVHVSYFQSSHRLYNLLTCSNQFNDIFSVDNLFHPSTISGLVNVKRI